MATNLVVEDKLIEEAKKNRGAYRYYCLDPVF